MKVTALLGRADFDAWASIYRIFENTDGRTAILPLIRTKQEESWEFQRYCCRSIGKSHNCDMRVHCWRVRQPQHRRKLKLLRRPENQPGRSGIFPLKDANALPKP